MIEAALTTHRLPAGLMSYSIFYNVIKNHAKSIDFNALLTKQNQRHTTHTNRTQEKQKNNRNNHQRNNNNKIIRNDNPFWKTKEEYQQLSGNERKAAFKCALKWSHEKQAHEKQNQGGAGNSQLPIVTFQLVTSDSTAGSSQLPHVLLAHNLMTSSTGMSSNDGQRQMVWLIT